MGRPSSAAVRDRAVIERVERRIVPLRGERVILDADLAALYAVPTKRLNEQVKRNPGRFPADFVFRLTKAEAAALNRSQFATGSQKHRDPRMPPLAFTEHGAVMAANVLSSQRAVEASVYVVRAFVRLRRTLASHKELAHKLAELERRVGAHDRAIRDVVSVIHRLAEPPPAPPRHRIGFRVPGSDEGGS